MERTLSTSVSRVLFLLIPVSICFSLRANAFVILFYAAAVLIQPSPLRRLRGALSRAWVWPFLAFYLAHLLSLAWSTDLEAGLFVLEKKASLFALPLLIAMDEGLDRRWIHWTGAAFVGACVLTFWGLLFGAGLRFAAEGDPTVFFYHQLGALLPGFSAVYFSFYFFIGLILVDYLHWRVGFLRVWGNWLYFFSAATLVLGLLLLASRLFLLLTAGYFLLRLLRAFFSKNSSMARPTLAWGAALGILIAGVLLLGVTRDRFQALLQNDFTVLRQDQLQWDTPLNGLTLRLLLLKYGWEILDRNNAWLGGVGIGDAQAELNAAMVQHNLYQGNPELGDTGYLDYDFHNQYIELWVQTGMAGLMLWLLVLWDAVSKGFSSKRPYPLAAFGLTLLLFAAVEGVVERQQGVVAITFFLSSFHLNPSE